MEEHPTIVVEHYSSYLEATDVLKSITRKNLYWEPKQKELVEAARVEQKLTPSKRLSKAAIAQIEDQNPFTWILAVNCSENLLKLCGAQPDPTLGVGVYRLVGLLRMGIVVISKVADAPEIMWLKMLGDRESANEAFGSIKQLPPDRREKTDIMRMCKKYCVYLKELSTTTPLTPEEEDRMRTMPEIDAWYETEMNNAKLEGEERRNRAIVLNMRRKNVSLETIAEFTGLTIGEVERLLLLPTE
jgi:hypothetical protein